MRLCKIIDSDFFKEAYDEIKPREIWLIEISKLSLTRKKKSKVEKIISDSIHDFSFCRKKNSKIKNVLKFELTFLCLSLSRYRDHSSKSCLESNQKFLI